LDCGACPVGMANERGDKGELARMAHQWGMLPEELQCGGCKGDVTAKFCARCIMRKCATEKGLEFCFQCGDYPCEDITFFRNDDAPHHSAVFSNLSRILAVGTENWLKEEEKRWSCPSCSRRFSWYQEKCPSCKAELYNAVSEEKDLEE